MKIIAALCLILSSTAVAAQPARAPAHAATACDRECLRGKVTEVLYALVDHDVSKLAVAPTLRVTEDGVEKALDKVGLVRTVTKLRGYRQDIIDTRAQQAVAGVMVEEAGAPILLVVRLKVDGEQKLSELELVTTRSRADGMIYNIDAYSGAPARDMNIAPRPEQLASRDKAIEFPEIKIHIDKRKARDLFRCRGPVCSGSDNTIEHGPLRRMPMMVMMVASKHEI